jgi:hypothetical protein
MNIPEWQAKFNDYIYYNLEQQETDSLNPIQTVEEAVVLVAACLPLIQFLITQGLTEIELEEVDEVALDGFKRVLNTGFSVAELVQLATKAGFDELEIEILLWIFNISLA